MPMSDTWEPLALFPWTADLFICLIYTFQELAESHAGPNSPVRIPGDPTPSLPSKHTPVFLR